MKTIKKDVLIIGSGLSGLYTSLCLNDTLKIGVVTKDHMDKSNSVLAQGGIASCIDKDDSLASHIKDTMSAGSNVNNVDAVTLLVSKAPKEIHKLIDLGVQFDKDEHGMILTTLEGGHSHKRILHAKGDATGQVIMETVVGQVLKKENIEILKQTMAIKIVFHSEQVVGVIVLNNNQFVFIETSVVVIASGGIGALYRHTTNHPFSTGDGIVLAKEAGCSLVDMCFVQFHPTAFYSKEGDKKFLITEAVRGEGGKLLDRNYKPFMSKYDKRLDLASRDVVSKSIVDCMQKQNIKHVWLDITQHSKDFLEKRFPTIYAFLKKHEIYMEKSYIPVAPVAHYFIGGITTDLDGRTTVDGIYACGEVSSTGVHGANRLASNSLLECLVFGKRTANHINKRLTKNNVLSQQSQITQHIQEQMKVLDQFPPCNDQAPYLKFKNLIQSVMTQYAGIIREDKALTIAYEDICKIKQEVQEFKAVCPLYFEVFNMCIVAEQVILDAIEKDSVGCHYKISSSDNES